MALPSGYRQLEYIQKPSSGSLYIDTGFRPKNTTRLVMEFYVPQNPDSSDYVAIFGGRTANGQASFSLWQQRNEGFRSDYNNSTDTMEFSGNYGRFTIDKNQRNTTFTNVETGTQYTVTASSTSSFTSNSNLTIFTLNSGNSIDGRQAYNMILYSCQIYDNGSLVRDFVPGQRISDDKVGLYDKVNGVFYSGTGNADFVFQGRL